MSTDNVENLVSVDEINSAIENFIGKHPENVNIWVDGETTTIQISNIGVRDKLFPRLAYLVKNTSIKDGLRLFNMRAECTYVSNQIIRFTCTLIELAHYSLVRREIGRNSLALADDPRIIPTTPPIEKFFSRLGRSNTLNSNAYDQALIVANQMMNK